MNLYYFSHPYTSYCSARQEKLLQEEANYKTCLERTASLIAAGYPCYSPIVMTHQIHLLTPQPPSYWIELDLSILSSGIFVGIIMAPGWKKSKGCMLELERAQGLGLYMFEYLDLVTRKEISNGIGTNGGNERSC